MKKNVRLSWIEEPRTTVNSCEQSFFMFLIFLTFCEDDGKRQVCDLRMDGGGFFPLPFFLLFLIDFYYLLWPDSRKHGAESKCLLPSC